jgi:alkyldihydroxyacetonephosphate synthase
VYGSSLVRQSEPVPIVRKDLAMPPRPRSTELPPSTEPMIWHGWGDPAQRHGLPEGAEDFLADRIGGLGGATPPVALEDVRVGASELSDAQRRALVDVVGREHVRDDHRTRVEHAGGKSYPDLLRRRQGDAVAAPDAVVLPASHEEVVRLLSACAEQHVAVVPFGGGTSVVGGVEPERGGFSALISLDLSRMDALLDLDEESGIATFQPGLRGPHAEALLRERGLTLGHFPQSYAYATLGGYVATRSAGQASTGYGRIDDLVVGARLATPSGELRAGHGAGSAAGPDLLALVTGSEGTLGVLTEVRLKVRPAPEVELHEAWVAPSFASGAATLRALVQAGVAPTITRLSDEDETATALAQQRGLKTAALRRYLGLRGIDRPCLVILGWEGTETGVERDRAAAHDLLDGRRLVRLGRSAGSSWARSRFQGPYLRDELMDRGVMVETLETAASWSRLGELYLAVRGALTQTLAERGTPPLVMCHISHLYPTGASLYFTWVARQRVGGELDQWHEAKTAASDAIIAHGGTITHHHAVGTDHRAWMTDEIGDLGVAVLRAVKDRLDPGGICNPGKLLPLGADDVLPNPASGRSR